MGTFDSFLAEATRNSLLRYVAGHAMFCRQCGSILDWKRVWNGGGITVCLPCSDKLNLRAAVRRHGKNPDDDEIVTESRPAHVPKFEIGARGTFKARGVDKAWREVRGIRLHLPLCGSWFAYRREGVWVVTNVETGAAAARSPRLRGAIIDTIRAPWTEAARKKNRAQEHGRGQRVGAGEVAESVTVPRLRKREARGRDEIPRRNKQNASHCR